MFGGKDGVKFLKLTPGSTASSSNCPCATSSSFQHVSKVTELTHHFQCAVINRDTGDSAAIYRSDLRVTSTSAADIGGVLFKAACDA